MPLPLLYEINTRAWLRQLSETREKAITLVNVPDSEFIGWQQLGFDHVWLMGVWTCGLRSRAQALANPDLQRSYAAALGDWKPEDVGGSPYAIADYRVPPALGGEEGLRIFRDRLHSHGMKLLLDFVPNHLGLDHPWVSQQPDLFVQSPSSAPDTFSQQTPLGPRWLAYGKDPYFPGWTDTVQLDYRNPATRAAMTGLLRSVADRCDGVRCDMAMLLLGEIFARTWERFPWSGSRTETEFWSSAISTIKTGHPGFLFLAEVYWGLEPRLRDLGFDYTYDKMLYDRIVSRDATGVQAHVLGLPPEVVARSAHFLENHDEPRIASLLSPEEQRAAALVILALPGMRFLHEGQLEGATRRNPVQLLRRAAEPAQSTIERMYRQFLAVLRKTAVGQGAFELIRPRPAWPENPTSQNFIIVQWKRQLTEFDLVVVNLAPHRSQCYAPLNVSAIGAYDWIMKDLLGEEEYVRPGRDLGLRGLYLDLPPHGAQVFHFEPQTANTPSAKTTPHPEDILPVHAEAKA